MVCVFVTETLISASVVCDLTSSFLLTASVVCQTVKVYEGTLGLADPLGLIDAEGERLGVNGINSHWSMQSL